MAGGRRGGGDKVDEALVIQFARRMHLPCRPQDRAGACALIVVPAVQHGPARKRDGRDIDSRRRHDLRRGGFVAAGGQHHGIERVAVKDLHKAQILEVAVKVRCRPLAGFLNGVDRELERHAPHLADAIADARSKLDMVPVAGRDIGARLGNADDRAARLQFIPREAVIHGPLDIDRRHVDVGGIVEPGAGPEPINLRLGGFACHGTCLRCLFLRLRSPLRSWLWSAETASAGKSQFLALADRFRSLLGASIHKRDCKQAGFRL